MICKICGCEMKNNGDWFACPTCGSVHFGPDPDEKKVADKPPVKKENPIPVMKEEPPKKEEPVFEFEKEFLRKAEPPVETEVKPVIKAEPPVKPVETPVEKDEPIPEINENPTVDAPDFIDKQEVFDEEPSYGTADSDDSSVKPSTFTEEDTTPDRDFSSFVDDIDEDEEEEAESQEEEEEEEEQDKKKKKLTLKDIVDFMLPIVAAVVIAFVLKTFIIANAKVPTGSMIATINIEDRIIASRLAYKTDSPQRYDIVLFYNPDDESEIFVKRVLGLPGETLEVIDGVVYVTTKDGKTIQTDQSFVNPAETPSGNSGPYYIPEKGEIITLEGNYCFAENGMVLGYSEFLDKYCERDERGNYVIAENLYFMMGDNRNYSSDSRAWDFPFVAENKIIGKVLFKYYPNFEKIK